MKLRCLAIALAFLALSASISWGQSKRPSQPQAQPAQQQTAPDQRGTESSPVVVKVLPAQENEEKARAESKEHDEKRKLDRDTLWLSAATVTIIFFQLLIFAAQAYFLWGTLKATAIAAKAAQTAAEAVQIVERPYVFIWGMMATSPKFIYTSSTDPAVQNTIQDGCRFHVQYIKPGKVGCRY